jgi:hypothetical protein
MKLLSRTSTFIGAGLFMLSAAAAVAAASADIDAPADNAIGGINTDETEKPRAVPSQDAKVQQQEPEPTLPGNPLWAIPFKNLTAMRERPIFSLSRRPLAPAVIAAPAAPVVASSKPVEPSRPQLTLVGTIIGTERGFGIFQDQAGNKALRLQTGEVHEGWVLREVRARATVFQRNDVRVTLELPVQTAARPSDVTVPDTRARR